MYQLQELKCFAQAKEHFTANFNEFVPLSPPVFEDSWRGAICS